MALMHGEQLIRMEHFPSLNQKNKDKKFAKIEILDDGQSSLPQLIEKIEKQMIIQYLQESGGNKQQTAKMLGIHSSALYRKLSKYGLE